MSKQPNQGTGAGDDPHDPKLEQYGTFRLDALGVSGSGAMIEGPPKRTVPVQAVVLGVIVVLAAGALYAMRRLGMGPMGAIAEVKIDYDYEKGAGGADHKKLLADLSTSHVDHQVPSDKVQKNPFKLPELHPALDQTVATAPVKDLRAEAEAKAAKERQDKIDAALATLKVHSVLSGAIPVARIGDENVRVGDTVAGLFTVVAISGRSVDLAVDNQTYTFSLDDEVKGRGPVRKTPKRR